ncbi:MAG: type II secretion system protein GspG [Arenimonas sp.]
MNMRSKSKSKFPRRRARGFTLIELVIVITLIAAVMAVVAGKVIQNKHKAEYKIAQSQLSSLASSIDQYQSDVGALPDSLEQLVAGPQGVDGWLGPYAKAADFKDPWHNAIEYRKPGADDNAYALTSLGVDGKAGGEGVDKDLVAP